MENSIIQLPEELTQIANSVSEEKRNEVQTVLNKVFQGVSKIREQLDKIEVSNEDDKVSMQMARTVRLAVREERLKYEDLLDSKRADVQSKMISYKTEDSLWLKTKQTMQILTKEIESIAKYKEETKARFDAEQKELKIQERVFKVSKFSDLNRSEFENMSDETFEMFLSGIEKQYNDKVEAEKRAELERVENERLDKLEQNRKMEIAPFAQFIGDNQDLRAMSDSDYSKLLADLQKAKSEYETEQEKIRIQNEELRAEKERIENLRAERSKELQPYIVFIRDYNGLLGKSENEYKSEFAEIKKGAEDHWEFERKEQIRIQKEKEENEEKIRIEKAKAAKIQKELDDKKAAELKIEQQKKESERLAKLESEKLAKAPIKKQLSIWVDSFELPPFSTKNETSDTIFEKFEAFKNWAKKEIENL